MSDVDLPRDETPVKRGRGRPRKDASLVPITKEAIAAEALKIIGAEGFTALTMNGLAARFGATSRALYNYVSDRQDVVNMAVELFIRSTPLLEFDPVNWRDTVRKFYRVSRALYRTYPWVAVVPITERVVVDGGPRYIEMMERLLRFYTEMGFSMPQALSLVRAFSRDIMSFALQSDYYFDRVPEGQDDYISRVVPQPWLDRYPEAEAPRVRESLTLPGMDNDDLFEELLQMRILTIQAMLDSLPNAR
ncbi:TetR/AcrR family transcriptional regulator C-terminal domain-containing protein [Glutamicibacter protophormiae]|uniref:TetR/AcrR family transcriptional regulator C-terminal domain-containing protein n=1 Tax=Glutamicibacter protophormiae TaxID=37930 RepID=UPI002A83AB8F|nr:TetR/AcrR family transcriptional regulator C-terminal domain-containing protein [Glutamicibacter protophormiae]WPR66023.1 TetR/AcrR family transcriptional regulator C-terminal domain-containing protein [Glutamicibacter protophormiae]WPR69520.1 TetR/AcrR family transcriptional regulator C-terminal domain-containing protein [Glutamicibacter protophormiae]